MAIRFSNNAQTTLASGITAAATSLTVADGSVFPALTPGDHTYVTLEDTSGNLEIVKVTAISSNTLTVTRGQDGTTAQAFSSGDFVQLRVTAALLNDLADEASVTLWADVQNKPDPVITLAGDATGSATLSDLASATLTVTIADDSHTHDGRYYTESEIGTFFAGTTAITGYNKSNWDTAYGWGDHGAVGYLTGNQTITLTGDVSGSGTTSIAVTIADDSHNHVISNVDGLQTALDAKLPSSSYTAADVLTKIKTVDGVGSGLDADLLDGQHGSTYLTDNTYLLRSDNRTISPSEYSSGRLAFGFTSWANNNTSPYADFLHMRSYTDSSGGADNLLMFKKDGIGMRLWQQSYGSTTAYSSYADFWHSGNDGSGSGLDADLLDGLQLHTGRNNEVNKVVRTDSNGYIQAGWINTPSGAFTSTINKIYASSDDYIRYVTPSTLISNLGIWTSANDGSGSGLDADFLDGFQLSSIPYATDGNTLGTVNSMVNGAGASANALTRSCFFRDNNVDFAALGVNIQHSTSTNYNFQFGVQSYSDPSSLVARVKNNGTWVSAVAIWNSGNDGSGSGLDADTVDGLNSSSFLRSDAATSGTTISATDAFRSSRFEEYDGTFAFRISGASGTTRHINLWDSTSDPSQADGSSVTGISWGKRNDSNPYYIIYADKLHTYGGDYSKLVLAWHTGVHIGGSQSYGGTRFWSDAPGVGSPSELMSVGKGDGHVRIANNLYIGSGTAWHSANDGSGSGLDADLLDGMNATSSVTGNTVVARNASGYIYANHINFNTGVENPTIANFITDNGDGWTRKSSLVHVKNQIRGVADGTWGISVTGSAGSATSATASDYLNSVNYATDYSSNLVYWQASGLGTDYAPDGSWYNTIRGSHGGGVSYYSNTLAMKMTGSYVGDIYTQTRVNGTLQGWNRFWHSNNDGSGSGLDADLLDGLQGDFYFKSATNNNGGWSQSNRNFSVRTGGNAVGLHMEESDGTFGFQVYGDGSSYGFLDGEWGNWDLKKITNGELYVDVGSGLQKVWHAGNDGSGSGLDADLLDGKDHTNFGATLATYGTTAGASGRIRCTAPFNTNSAHMFQVTVSVYSSYTVHTYVVGGYMYPTTNQWHSPTVIYSGSGNPDIVVGRDSSGKAYISIANGNYAGVRVHNMTLGYQTSVADTYDPWTITINGATENSVTPTVAKTWTSVNDGSGSGLDADLLDGVQASQFLRSDTSNALGGDLTITNRAILSAATSNWTGNPGANGKIQYHANRWYIVTDSNSNRIVQFRVDGADKSYIDNNGTLIGGGMWSSYNDGSGSGLDADTCDGQHLGTTSNPTFNTVRTPGANAEVKFSVWSGTTYGIGMQSGVTYGGLNDYAMTFCMNNDSDRGFWWGYSGQAKSAGAMSLTTGGILTVASSITAGGNITAYSDRRLKEDLRPITDALSKVQKLSGNTYTRNDQKDTETRYAGLIAQECAAVLPESVKEADGGVLALDYNAITALLLESIRELKAEVDDLKAQLKEK